MLSMAFAQEKVKSSMPGAPETAKAGMFLAMQLAPTDI
jgi:hypothetical protein